MTVDGSQTITLTHPVEYGDTVVAELKFRRPKGKHIRKLNLPALEAGDMGYMMDLAADLCGQPPELFDLLDAEDIGRAVKVTNDFLEVIAPGLTTP